MLSRIICLENECTLHKLSMNRGTQKNNNKSQSIKKKKKIKSVLAWFDGQIKSNNNHYL